MKERENPPHSSTVGCPMHAPPHPCHWIILLATAELWRKFNSNYLVNWSRHLLRCACLVRAPGRSCLLASTWINWLKRLWFGQFDQMAWSIYIGIDVNWYPYCYRYSMILCWPVEGCWCCLGIALSGAAPVSPPPSCHWNIQNCVLHLDFWLKPDEI